MDKVGRNEPCPCGSGKKYKRCHGFSGTLPNRMEPNFEAARARAEARHVQRERQQGLGKPIISTEFAGQRLVAVKNRLLHSGKWKTFEDFLCDYIKIAIGPDWGNAEIAKPLEERHPILLWYQKLCQYQQTFITSPGKVNSAPLLGVVAAYLHLAYDLYAIDHNAELQGKLLCRLRNKDQFSGARYELFVAASIIRAGFDIEFENESDGNTTHCEFTAKYRRTGKRFSVEAKRREGHRERIGRLFNGALSKQANHTRVVFIDINLRDDATDESPPTYLPKVFRRLRSLEGQTLNGIPAPPAYVFVTNAPWDLHLDEPAPRSTFLAEGFQIPDFKSGVTADLRKVINAREAHIEMHKLIKSMREHANIPSTFDGESPEYTFHTSAPRILIGDRLMLPDETGVERAATVTAAVVFEAQQMAHYAVTFDGDGSGMFTKPLTPEELAAWRRHPDTFFGVVGQRKTEVKGALELYDFLHESFMRESKERLLEVMAGSPDFEELRLLDQPRLASIHAERMTHAALATQATKAAPSDPELSGIITDLTSITEDHTEQTTTQRAEPSGITHTPGRRENFE